MSTSHLVVTGIAAFMAAFSAGALLLRAEFVVGPLVEYRVPQSWWTPLGLAKAAGAVGLVLGLFVPYLGALAAIGLVLYFAGAAVTVLRARSYGHVAFPLMYLAPAALTLVFA
ncbi:membrane protein [Kitasatospora sp. MMS16-BH015]|uniref:DoxX family protein n=1 Tax=Kitasatospora sp. MMS16-BH015 TaxID=2018025 RepID=UPI000CA0FB12|nr:DoxX family protein [Kitasatospora sp. MMS16-BH015]AUG77829.1 membrane protein [Kitasatospora sp. MMS16-BH015]